MDVNENQVIEILKGRYDNLSKERSKIVRIFLSSTFTDTHEERDYLIENVYPKLKKYSKLNYGLDFQVLDMRWGVTSESTINHLNTTVCLNEVKNCQKYSIGPNFVTLLSHKYGNRDVPSRIQVDEFQILKEELEFNKTDLSFKFKNDECNLDIPNILEYSYKLDENEIPFRYKLLSLRSLIPGYEHNKPNFKKAWSSIEQRIGNILRTAAQSCHNREKISFEQYEKYFVSITEKEIFDGIMSANNTDNNCLVFYREIEDIESNVNATNRKLIKRFIDLDENGNIDENAKTLLNQLKYKKLIKALPETNQHHFKVKWNENGGVTRVTHPEYMQQFGNTFYDAVKELIDRNASKSHYLDNFSLKDRQLFQEVLDHASFCNECVDKFHGRTDLIDQIKNYILSKANRPFVIYGESGCGKTSVVAKVAHELFNFVPIPQDYVAILRFMGTTPTTSNITSTYKSVLNQLSRIFNVTIPDKKISSKEDLRDYFLTHLLDISNKFAEKTIVIFLDSIDQLSTDDYNTDWMVFDLPSNVKMVYSTLPQHGGILSSIRCIPLMKGSCFLEIGSLNKSIVKIILDDWLSNHNHRLTDDQWGILDTLFDKAKMFPLYVKLIFDIIVKWTSFFKPDEKISRLLDIDKCIEYLFKLLEKDHGKMLFSRSMVYMSSFKNGISESELEDILSIDDDVLFEIFEYHAPPIRRFPVVLWSRIKHDLSEYMVEKEVNDTRVIYWYHRRFIEVANSVYVSTLINKLDTVFQNVVDFFNETWKNTPKPYKFTKHVAAKKNLDSDKSEATRNTSIQSTVFVSADGIVRYNKRKLTELPKFISKLTPNLAIPLSIDHVLLNYEFLHGLFVVCDYKEIYEHLKDINEKSSFAISAETKEGMKNSKFLILLFLQCGISVSGYPDSLSVQMIAQSLSCYGVLKYFTKFINESDSLAARDCAFTVPYQFLQPPGLGVLFTFEKHIKPIVDCIVDAENKSKLFTLSDKIVVFNMTNLLVIGTISLPKLDSKDEYRTFRALSLEIITNDVSKLSQVEGYFTVISTHTLVSVNFDNTMNFEMSFENEIENIHQISPNHILIYFKSCDYFQIYNCFTGKLVKTQTFNNKIKFLASTSNDNIVNPRNYVQHIAIVLILDDGSLNIWTIYSSSIYDKNCDNISFELINSFQPPGIECVGCNLLKHLEYDYTDSPLFCISYKDGSFMMVSLSKRDKIHFIKPQLNEVTEEGTQITLKLLEFSDRMNSILLLASNRFLYFTTPNQMDRLHKIGGFYDHGQFIEKDHICGIHKNMIDIYTLNYDTFAIRIIKLCQIDAHYADITKTFYIEHLFLTTSRDSTLKLFELGTCKFYDEYSTKFDRTNYHIQHLSNLDATYFLSYSLENPEIKIWNASTGKIMGSIELKVKSLSQFIYKNSMCCFIESINHENSTITVSACKVDLQTYQSKFNYEVELNNCCDTQMWYANDKFLILAKLNDHFDPINLHIISFDTVKNQWLHNQIVNIRNDVDIDAENNNDLDHFTSSYLNSLLVFFNKEEIVFINFDKTIKTVKKKLENKLKSDYFINGRNSLTQISETDDFIALNNLNQLVYIECSNTLSKIILYASEGVTAKFTKIEANRQIICAYDEKSENLFVYEREKCKKDQFKKPLFKAEFKNNSLSKLCISDNNEYILTVELPKIVSLYRIKDGKRIAHVPMYSEISSIAMSDNYVAMAMQDRRIVSLLITDPLKPDNDKLIKALPSRNLSLITEEKKQKIENILNFLLQIFDNNEKKNDYTELFAPGDDTESIDYYTKYNWKNSETYKRLRKSIQTLPCNASFMIELTFDQFEEKNWLLNLNKTHKFIDDKQLSILTCKKKPTKNLLMAQTTIDLGFTEDLKKNKTLTEEYKKQLTDELVKSNDQKLKFTNTGKNVMISNAHTVNSRMCNVS